MADCSKTLDFLNERKRLCDTYWCKSCPARIITKVADVCPIFDDDLCNDKDTVIDFVQKWSDEHPAPKPKTYADVFLEEFPNASKCYLTEKDYVNGNGFPEVKRCNLYGVGIHGCKEGSCTRETQMKCWNEPYPEQEERE